MWTGIFLKTLLVCMRIFFIRVKKMRFQKYSDRQINDGPESNVEFLFQYKPHTNIIVVSSRSVI